MRVYMLSTEFGGCQSTPTVTEIALTLRSIWQVSVCLTVDDLLVQA